MAHDPDGSTWRTNGFRSSEVLVAGDTYTLDVRFNERILPSKVRDEHLGKVIAKFHEREGRKPGKKEFAMLKEDVETQLLPRAFIRRTDVSVTFDGGFIYVWCGSLTKCDVIMSLVSALLNHSCKAVPTLQQYSVSLPLTEIAHGNDRDLAPGKAATLRHAADKRAIKVKDLDIEAATVQDLLKEGWQVTELAMQYGDDSLTVNDQLVLKKLNITHADDEDVTAVWLAVQFVRRLLKVFQRLDGDSL